MNVKSLIAEAIRDLTFTQQFYIRDSKKVFLNDGLSSFLVKFHHFYIILKLDTLINGKFDIQGYLNDVFSSFLVKFHHFYIILKLDTLIKGKFDIQGYLNDGFSVFW